MIHVAEVPTTSRLLWEGTVVDVVEPGTHRSYVRPLSDPRLETLVDNDQLEWLPGPARPTRWELLAGPGWVVG